MGTGDSVIKKSKAISIHLFVSATADDDDDDDDDDDYYMERAEREEKS